MADPRAPTRAELAKFLPDQRTIRAFEQLFDLVPDGFDKKIEAVSIEAGTANAQAVEAIAAINRLSQALESLAKAPVIQKDTFLKGDYIDLPFNGPHVTRERRIQWNDDDGTLDVGLYNDVVLQVGQETLYYAKNTSGVSLPIGTPVMFTGTVGSSGKLTFGKAVADGSVLPDYMMGVTAQTIANNGFGYVTSFGLVRGFNTSGTPVGETWNDGDLLYFDPATPGTFTNIKPSAPNIHRPVAVVVTATSGNSGSIFVRMGVNEGLAELLDVEIASVANSDMLVYISANSRWENRTPSQVRTSLGLGSMALQNTGASGSFTTADSKTVTVSNGIITSIV